MPSEDCVNNEDWLTVYRKHNRCSQNTIALDRANGYCLELDLGLSNLARYHYLGRGWLFSLGLVNQHRLLEWLASDDYGPFVYVGWAMRPERPPFSEVHVSIVRENVGPVAVCVGTSKPVTRSPWREWEVQSRPRVGESGHNYAQ